MGGASCTQRVFIVTDWNTGEYFHIASSCFEIPSGVVADVFGRKRTLALSKLVSVLSCLAMILSDNFGTVAFAIAFSALSYNLNREP